MDFERFKAALVDCAAARNVDADTFISIVANCQPLVHATVAESVKWHDDRSTYTGGPCGPLWRDDSNNDCVHAIHCKLALHI
jgi:hypothetical protein